MTTHQDSTQHTDIGGGYFYSLANDQYKDFCYYLRDVIEKAKRYTFAPPEEHIQDFKLWEKDNRVLPRAGLKEEAFPEVMTAIYGRVRDTDDPKGLGSRIFKEVLTQFNASALQTHADDFERNFETLKASHTVTLCNQIPS